jgi:two-component system alkaline phosphatase synthesis response regulator PhoP
MKHSIDELRVLLNQSSMYGLSICYIVLSMKIAIIEDDLAIAQMYSIKFETEGYQVQSAENGKLGLELVEKMRPDIVLLDLMMPEMNGDEVLTLMRKTDWGKDIKVIILTNMGEQEAPEILKQLNVSAFIVKADMTPKQVAELVKSKLS